MKRLVVFGCSYTFGDGLPDCQSGSKEHSKLAWPSVLSQDLGLYLSNNSSCGASNKKILLDILQYTFRQDDIVIVLWSFAHRGLIFDESGHINLINKNDKNFYQVHTEHDLVMDTLLHMNHAKNYLKHIVKNYFSFYFDRSINVFMSGKTMQVPSTAEFIPLKDVVVDNALDGMHPGIQSHKNIAGYIFSKMR